MGNLKIKYTGTNIGEHEVIYKYSPDEVDLEYTPIFEKETNIIGLKLFLNYPLYGQASTLVFNFEDNSIESDYGCFSFHIITSIVVNKNKSIITGNLSRIDIEKESVDNFSFLIFLEQTDLSSLNIHRDFFWDISKD